MEKDVLNIATFDRGNLIYDVHELFSSLAAIYRNGVCEECSWSTPTFYRKIRTRDIVNPENPEKVISAISNAERAKGLELFQKIYHALGLYIEKYQ